MMNEEDIYAYMFKAKGMTGRMAKKLCKPNVSFEHIFNTDYKSTFLNAFSEGVDDNFTNESDLLKLSKIIENIRKDEKVLREEAKNFYEKLIRENISWTHLNRDDYPEKLKSIIDPPPVIFYKGKLPSNDKPSVAIIGARQCSPYGEKAAKLFAKELSISGVQIISGMAKGIDGISQRKAIEVNGSTFGILGCGVDVIYPKENDDIFVNILKDGGLISEFEPGIEPIRRYFPSRNRIISALSDIVIVVEARRKSGTYITVTQALEQGREVYAVPGRITDLLSEGCNELINSGAGIALNSETIIEELKNMGYKMTDSSFAHEEKTKYSDSLEGNILKILSQNECSLDEIYYAFREKTSIEELSVSLVELETEGKIRKIGSKYFYI